MIHSAGDAGSAEHTEVFDLVSDSRKVRSGSIFACVEGEHSDGHDFANSAICSGATLLLCEHTLDICIPQIICSDVRRNMGRVASLLYGDPSSKLKMAAITGTNGKTTSTVMTKSILETAGVKTGRLGNSLHALNVGSAGLALTNVNVSQTVQGHGRLSGSGAHSSQSSDSNQRFFHCKFLQG